LQDFGLTGLSPSSDGGVGDSVNGRASSVSTSAEVNQQSNVNVNNYVPTLAIPSLSSTSIVVPANAAAPTIIQNPSSETHAGAPPFSKQK
jgi:hypothetical protein